MESKELREGLLAHHPLSLQIALLDVLGGQAVRSIDMVQLRRLDNEHLLM